MTDLEKRQVGLEIEGNVAALKAAVDAIDTAITAWELRGLDTALPTDEAIKTQLDAYNAVLKPSMSLNDALASANAVVLP